MPWIWIGSHYARGRQVNAVGGLSGVLSRGWLFVEALGYGGFGTLEDYPPGQTRAFLRKRLG